MTVNKEQSVSVGEPVAWKGLTDDEKFKIWQETETDNRMVLIDVVEAELMLKNGVQDPAGEWVSDKEWRSNPQPQPKQEKGEPVAWRRYEDGMWVYYETKAWDDLQPLYTTPPQRKPLTDEQLKNYYQNNEWLNGVRFAEQFHGITEEKSNGT